MKLMSTSSPSPYDQRGPSSRFGKTDSFHRQDGTVQEVKQEEHSSLEHYITYSVISSEPALTYSSVLTTIKCFPVTSGDLEGSTFVRYPVGCAFGTATDQESLIHRSPSVVSSLVMPTLVSSRTASTSDELFWPTLLPTLPRRLKRV
jgi:hypothetical protein